MNRTIPIVTQNVDRVVRMADYNALKTDELVVTSMFRTIQGEGPFAGYPAVFLRLSGCNFGDKQDHCAWCDTAFHLDKGTMYTPNDLLEKLQQLPGYRKSDILVVTGGEPTLQLNLIHFMRHVGPFFKLVQIETNGTQAGFFRRLEEKQPQVTQRGYIEHFNLAPLSVVVSPKASTKAGRTPQLSEVVLRHTGALKFVVTADANDPQHVVPEWVADVQQQYSMPVYVSPMAVYRKPYAGEVSSIWDAELINQQATAVNYAYAARYAMEHGFLLSLQTHLFTAVP